MKQIRRECQLNIENKLLAPTAPVPSQKEVKPNTSALKFVKKHDNKKQR